MAGFEISIKSAYLAHSVIRQSTFDMKITTVHLHLNYRSNTVNKQNPKMQFYNTALYEDEDVL